MKWLSVTEYVYNDGVNATTSVTPFYTNYRYHLQMERALLDDNHRSLLEEERVEALQALHSQLHQEITLINIRMAYYYNRKREDMPNWAIGDKVYISRANLGTL
jgi:hypothetical protein